MKKSLSLIAAMAILGTGSALSADSLSDAFQNGKVTGDVAITYENRKMDTELGDGWYDNSAYSVASAGLNFETAKFNNFSLGLGFRGFTKVWEDSDGDADNWFSIDDSQAVFTNTFMAYSNDIANVKVGRQSFRTEWMTDDFDALTAYITPFEKAELELIYASKSGDLTAREYYAMQDIGEDGEYKIGFTYSFSDALSAKAYYMDAPKFQDLYGVRADVYTTAGDVEIGGFGHYMSVNDEVANEKGTMIDAQVYVGVSGWYGYLGYTDNDNGALGKASYVNGVYTGDTVVQFEEGDQMYLDSGDNTTMYAMLYKNLSGLDLTVLYGTTEYDYNDPTDYSKAELAIWAGYAFRDDFRGDLGFMQTMEDDTDSWTTDVTQVNLTLTYTY